MERICSWFEAWSLSSMVIRLVSAMIIGILVGIDRGVKRRSAGVKTYVLVCLGSALVMMTSQYIFMKIDPGADLLRMGAQVISGVGFLGVGTIIVTSGNHVRGLTTAAGLWVCACEGLAVGIGYVQGAFITLLIILFTLKVLSYLDGYLHRYAKNFGQDRITA